MADNPQNIKKQRNGNSGAGEITEAKQKWEAEKKITEIPKLVDVSGYEHKVLYTPEDVEINYMDDLGFAGEYPFTRGVYPGMYRKAPWRINQYAGFGTPEDTNKRWKALLARGQMVFNLPFDLPTQIGYDSDDELVEDEVGMVGVSIDTLRDFEVLYDDIAMLPTYFNVAGSAAVMMSMFIALGEKKGVPPSGIMGAITNDILAIYVARGTWIFPPKPSLRLIADMIEYTSKYMDRYYPLNIQGVYHRSVGATAPQEVGYVFSDALTYVDAALEKGLHIDQIAPKLSFFFACGPEFLKEAAKFRAARRVWAKLMKERYGAKNKESMRLKTTAATGGLYFQSIEPLNNLMRGAYGILGSVLGGAQATFIAGYDEAYALPNEESALLGLRTLQILQEETDVARTIDPLAGSYYVEDMTNWFESEIMKYLKEIEDHGGTVASIESGYMRKQMDLNFMKMYNQICKNEIPVVGVNKHRAENVIEPKIELHKHNTEAIRTQQARLKEIKGARSSADVSKALKEVSRAAKTDDNLIPPLVDAAKVYCTVGEICAELKEVFGEFKEPAFF